MVSLNNAEPWGKPRANAAGQALASVAVLTLIVWSATPTAGDDGTLTVPVTKPAVCRINAAAVDSIQDDGFYLSMDGDDDTVEVEDIRIAPFDGNAPGTLVEAGDASELGENDTCYPFTAAYFDVDFSGTYNGADYVYLGYNKVKPAVVSGSTHGGEWWTRITSSPGHAPGSLVVAGDSDLQDYGPGSVLPGNQFSYVDLDANTDWNPGDRAYLSSQVSTTGDPVPINSVRLVHGQYAFGSKASAPPTSTSTTASTTPTSPTSSTSTSTTSTTTTSTTSTTTFSSTPSSSSTSSTAPSTTTPSSATTGPSPTSTTPPSEPLTIQELVDRASPGDEVVVPAGQFRENVRIEKDLTLVADGNVRVDGGSGPAFLLRGARITLIGLQVNSAGPGIVMEDAPWIQLDGVTAGGKPALQADHVDWVLLILPPETIHPTLPILEDSTAVHLHRVRIQALDTDTLPLADVAFSVYDGDRRVAEGRTDAQGLTPPVLLAHETYAPGGTVPNRTTVHLGEEPIERDVDPHTDPAVVITPLSALALATGAGPATWLADPVVAVPVVAAAAALAVGVAFQLHEGFRWRWLAWLAPLFSRLAKAQVLEHGVREAVYGYIEENPGVNLRRIQRDLALKHGTLLHHLQMLQTHGHVKSVKDGMYRRFFVAGAAPRFEGQGDLADQIAEFIKNNPGTTNLQVAAALRKRPSLVHYHVQRLAEGGRVRKEPAGREVRLHFGPPTAEPAEGLAPTVASPSLALRLGTLDRAVPKD